MWPCSTLETYAQVHSKVVQTSADLHEAQQAYTVESLAQVFANDIWVILVNLGQEHQGWNLCTASFTKHFRPIYQCCHQVKLHMHEPAQHTEQFGKKNLQCRQLCFMPLD